MLQKYYPVWLFIIIFSDLAYATMDLNLAVKRGWFNLFVTDSLVSIFIYLIVIGALGILKPHNILVRISVMVVSMPLSVSLATFLICRVNNLPPIPFSGMDQVISLLMGYFTSGICIIWFFSIEERQYVAEKKIAAARIKVALNEKKVLENHLRLLQAQIEPHFLFNTLTSIVSLGKKNPPKAKVMQIHLIDYLESTLAKTRSGTTTIFQEIELLRSYKVYFFKADGGYTAVITKSEQYLIRKTISDLAEQLDPAVFFQIHRGVIVNASCIDKVSFLPASRGMLRLKDRDEVLTISGVDQRRALKQETTICLR